jgi:hypothetical protein
MASNERVFLAGVGTTLLILALGFGGGVMLSRTGPKPSTTRQVAAAALPSVRVILPASAEPAEPAGENVQPTAASETMVGIIKEGIKAGETDQQIRVSEHRTATAERRHRRNKMAERKARREATRVAGGAAGISGQAAGDDLGFRP